MTRGRCPSAERQRGARCFGSEPLATPIPSPASLPADRACVARARHTRRSASDRHPPRNKTHALPRRARSSPVPSRRRPRSCVRAHRCARVFRAWSPPPPAYPLPGCQPSCLPLPPPPLQFPSDRNAVYCWWPVSDTRALLASSAAAVLLSIVFAFWPLSRARR